MMQSYIEMVLIIGGIVIIPLNLLFLTIYLQVIRKVRRLATN